MNFSNFFTRLWKYRLKKNWGYNGATVSSIAGKIIVYDMESH